jgi:AAT family amino acid transporter
VFSPVNFVSYYIELPAMLVMYGVWMATHRPSSLPSPSLQGSRATGKARQWLDAVNVNAIDLKKDEYEELPEDLEEDVEREKHLKGRMAWAWKLYYLIA